MNLVKIEYFYMSSKAEISINGERISTYSDMMELINSSFYEIGNQIIEIFDKEIFDDYEIEFLGTEYQYQVLKYYQEKSDFCKNISFVNLEIDDTKTWYSNYIIRLAEKYCINTRNTGEVKLYATSEEILLSADNVSICGQEEADLGIYEKLKDGMNASMSDILILCDKYDFEKIKNKRVFYIPKKVLNAFIKFYQLYCVQVPMLESVIGELKYMKLEEKDKSGINACISEKATFYLENVPSSMDVGAEIEIIFESFPPNSYFLRVENEEILKYQNNILAAKASGIGKIEVITVSDEVMDAREITIIKHNYVNEIRVLTEFDYLNINDRNRIEIAVIPGNAEDADDLKWEIEDQSVAQIRENGEIIALTEGKTKLRISGRKAVKELEIEVKPIVSELRFREQWISLKPGETVIVECEVIPPNASGENLKWSFDNEVIASFAPSFDGKKCKLQAKKEHSGRGNLRCVDQKQHVSAVCNVEVRRLKAASSLAGAATAFLIMGALCMPFLTPVSTILSIIGLMKSEVEKDRKTFKVCLIISALQIIGWLILFVIASLES